MAGEPAAVRSAGDAMPARRRQRPCAVYDHHQELVPYHTGWQWQKDVVARMTAFPPPQTGGAAPPCPTDSLIILQHPPIYTLGAGSTESNLLFARQPGSADHADSCQPGQLHAPAEWWLQHIPVVRTERGGEVTYHGPGQLVMYPLMDLAQHTKDLHWYMRQLEEVAIRALWEVSGLRGGRVEGLTGVWVGNDKVAAIGVRARKWVTFHGLALNICPDLSPFQDIVPCGIPGRGVTSVQRLLGLPCGVHPLSMAPSAGGLASPSAHAGSHAAVEQGAGNAAGASSLAQRQELLDEYSYALLEAFSEVFDLDLEVVRSPDA